MVWLATFGFRGASGHLAEDFRQPFHLCPVDLAKLRALVGCDLRRRYDALGAFFARHGMPEDAAWVRRAVAAVDARLSTSSLETAR